MIWVLCLFFLFQTGISTPTNEQLRPCRRSDPDVSNCLSSQIPTVLRRFQDGHPGYGVDPIDPLNVEFMTAEGDLQDFKIKTVMKNITLYGLTNIKFHQFEFQSDSLSAEIKGTIPALRVTFDYFATGKLFTLPLESSARFDGNFTDIEVSMSVDLQTVQKKNKEYFTINNISMKTDLATGHIDLVSFDPSLQPQVNVIRDFYNENVKLITKTTKPFANEHVGHFYKYVIEKYLRKIPATDFLPY